MNISPSVETYAALERAAKSRKIKVSAVVLWIVESWLRDNGFL